jgi:hypothetical protein
MPGPRLHQAATVPAGADLAPHSEQNFFSLGKVVTCLAGIAIAQRPKLVSSNSEVRYASDASCRAWMACDWKRWSGLKSWVTSRTRRWKGSLRIRTSVDF